MRAALRAARVHCSPKLLKMGYALIVGHTPAEATGCGQAAGMRRTLLNALILMQIFIWVALTPKIRRGPFRDLRRAIPPSTSVVRVRWEV